MVFLQFPGFIICPSLVYNISHTFPTISMGCGSWKPFAAETARRWDQLSPCVRWFQFVNVIFAVVLPDGRGFGLPQAFHLGTTLNQRIFGPHGRAESNCRDGLQPVVHFRDFVHRCQVAKVRPFHRFNTVVGNRLIIP